MTDALLLNFSVFISRATNPFRFLQLPNLTFNGLPSQFITQSKVILVSNEQMEVLQWLPRDSFAFVDTISAKCHIVN